MVGNILLEIPHIKLRQLITKRYCLSIEDTELFDFVEDFLWDNYNIETDDIELDNSETVVICNYFFESDFDISALIIALKEIDVQEIERIYKLNN